MAHSLQLEIVTPDRVVLSREVDYVAVPGFEGEFGVLPGHTPLLAALRTGRLRCHAGNDIQYVCLSGGFAQVTEEKVTILADSGELAEEIDLPRAEEARKRAVQRLEEAKGGGDVNAARAESALRRAVNRLSAKTPQ
jgi:F-type H+-transporting ATPase subunit epsilon